MPSAGSGATLAAGSEVARGLRFFSAAETLSSVMVLRVRIVKLPARRRRNELRNERRSDCILVIFPPDSFSNQHTRDHVSKQGELTHTFNNGAVSKYNCFEKKVAYSKTMTGSCSNSINKKY